MKQIIHKMVFIAGVYVGYVLGLFGIDLRKEK